MDFGNFDIFAAKDEVAHQERVLTLDPQRVYGDPHNVRRAIRQEEIDALADTISARGQLQPIIVAPPDDEGRYMIQFGERRWRACLQLGRDVRAIIREVEDSAQVRLPAHPLKQRSLSPCRRCCASFATDPLQRCGGINQIPNFG